MDKKMDTLIRFLKFEELKQVIRNG